MSSRQKEREIVTSFSGLFPTRCLIKVTLIVGKIRTAGENTKEKLPRLSIASGTRQY